MADLLYSPWMLVPLVLLLRFLPFRDDREAPWRWPTELGIAASLGLATAVAKLLYFAPFHSSGSVSIADQQAICLVMNGLREGIPAMVDRKPGAAIVPAVLSNWIGINDALAVTAFLSVTVIGATLYLWGRTLHGRSAGIAAVLFSCAIAPHAILTRFWTFYPPATCAYIVCAASGAALLRWRNPPALFVAGTGAGLALLVDFVGLPIALPVLALALVVALWAPPRRIPLRLTALAVPLLLSFALAHHITPKEMRGFEDEIARYIHDSSAAMPGWAVQWEEQPDFDDLARDLNFDWPGPDWTRKLFPPIDGSLSVESYKWGHSSPLDIARTLYRLAFLSMSRQTENPAELREPTSVYEERQHHIYPWIGIFVVGMLATAWALKHRRWELLGLMFVLLPFALALWYQCQTRVLPRYILASMSPWPILLGIGWAQLTLRPWSGPPPGQRWARLAPLFTGVVVAALLTADVPNFFHGNAPWRRPSELTNDFAYNRHLYQRHRGDPERLHQVAEEDRAWCLETMLEDERRGLDPEGRIFPWLTDLELFR